MKYPSRFTSILVVVLLITTTLSACTPANQPAESVPSDTTTVQTAQSTTATVGTTVPSTTQITSQTTEITSETAETTVVTTQASETQQTPLLSDEDFIFVNEFGDSFDIRDADAIISLYQNVNSKDMVKEKFYTIVNEKFTYLTKSIGVSYNSIDDPYDQENRTFNVEVPEQNYEWFKVYPGDKFGSLTVEEALIYYEYMNGVATTGGFDVHFSGSFTVTGYITCVAENGAYVAKGDLLFSVDAETWGDIPILLVPRKSGHLPQTTYEAEIDGYCYASDIHVFDLGNIYSDDFSGVDISLIPDDGSYKRVSVTLTDFEMLSREGMTSGIYYARIESISPIEE